MWLSNIEIDQNGSESKLNTISDGFKVIKTIFALYKNYKPMAFFSIVAGILFVLGLAFFVPVFVGFLHSGLVRIPTLLVSVLFFICSVQSLFAGLILDNIIKTSKQNFEMRLIDCEHRWKKEGNGEENEWNKSFHCGSSL